MKTLLNILLALSLSLIISCGDNLESKDELRVGLTADYPPFEFMKDNVISGFDVDLAKMIAKNNAVGRYSVPNMFATKCRNRPGLISSLPMVRRSRPPKYPTVLDIISMAIGMNAAMRADLL